MSMCVCVYLRVALPFVEANGTLCGLRLEVWNSSTQTHFGYFLVLLFNISQKSENSLHLFVAELLKSTE